MSTDLTSPAVPVVELRAPVTPPRASSLAVWALPALLAAGLGAVELTTRSLSLDEAATVTIAGQHGAALGHAIARDGGNMAGYYALMHVLIAAAGNGPLVLRLPSLLAAAATVGVLARLGQRLFGPAVGLAAGLLAAVSLPLLFWAQTARGYALLVMFVTAAFLALVEALEAPGRRAPLLAYGLATVLGLYMGFVAVLAVPAQLVVLARHRGRARAVLATLLAVAVAAVPLAVLAVRRGAGQLAWVPGVSGSGVRQVLEALTSAGLPPNFHPPVTAVATLVVTLGLLALFATRARDWRAALVVSWAVVPVLLALVESWLGQPLFLARNVLLCLPAVALLLAWGLLRLPAPWAWVAGLLALRALALVPAYGTSPEDWRAATARVIAHPAAGSCIAFFPGDGRMAFRYYAGARAKPSAVLPAVPWSDGAPFVEDDATLPAATVAGLPARCPVLWLVAGHHGTPGGSAASRAANARYVILRRELEAAYPRHVSARFGYAPAVEVERLSATR